ncbi:MAG TPA: carboxypeptidase regulatory-like domain-containing protein [Gemmatimonadaceae bacterium]|nr:carboxypeptidase regulatory-like domain-containing protein [Gemmatimonadaceae bacterium]
MSLWSCKRARVAALALGSAVALASGEPVAAQVVRGVVTEKATNAPLDGVVLTVLDPRDSVVVQVLSNDGGGYEIRLPSAGMYTVDVKRIGVKRVRLTPFAIGEGETKRLDITLEPVPAVLASVNITGRTSCVKNPQTNAKTAALWEDARAALTASVITRSLTVGNDSVMHFTRKLDVNSWKVLAESRQKLSASIDHPFKSLPAEVLSVGGYITVNQDSTVDYYAPDADVLLSDTFLTDHCFKIEAGTFEHTGYVGLAFQPVKERKKPDIKGVLWMDAKTHELRTLEFTYNWLPNDLRPGDFGGTVSFFRLPGGRWIVRSWRIRMPEFGWNRPGYGRLSLGVVRIAEEGGVVPLNSLLNQGGNVQGVVVLDTVSNQPIAGITVALEGTADSTRTAADGSFELPFVAPGSYTVVLRHPALDSLGIQHLVKTVEVEAGKIATMRINFPSNEELAGRMCSGVPVDFKRQSIIRFIVLDQAGTPLSKAPAVLYRIPINDEGKPVVDSASGYDVTLDATGGVLGCALGENEIVRIEGVSDADTSTNTTSPPWAENLRPRSGAIGWHVVRIGKKR